MRAGIDAAISRPLLRDLVALSAVPSVWVERAATVGEPGTQAVAAELADALVGLLELDFAFVRLCDPGGAGTADVTRARACTQFADWLQTHLAGGARLNRRALIADVGDPSQPCRGFAVPIGFNGEAGVIAAASERTGFPTATDQLLLSLAANQAATAFQSARLIQERRTAAEALREARDGLEAKVAERTAELQRSEAYLAEGQRLTRTGSFAIDASTHEVTHSSAEHSRLYGFDPERGTPSLSEFLERIHPHDRARCIEALETGIRYASSIDLEYRVVLPRSPIRLHRALAHPVFDASGKPDEIVGTIVDITERRRAETELGRFAGEAAALRQVATLVAREASQAEVFAAIASELGRLMSVDHVRMWRFEGDEEATAVASTGTFGSAMPVGLRKPLNDDSLTGRVRHSGRDQRVDDYTQISGRIAERAREIGVGCAVATPIVVEGRLWGAMVAASREPRRLPGGTETRMAQFTELMATAIGNTESRGEVQRLADEQAALRQVATLVAEGAPPSAVFDAVAAEVKGLLRADHVVVCRYEPGAELTVLAHRGSSAQKVPPGTRISHEGDSVEAMVRSAEKSARRESYEGADGLIAELARAAGVRVAVGAPVVVDGRLWGVVSAGWNWDESPPADTEQRLTQFAQLLDTAIANADSRDQLTASRARVLTAADEARRRVVRDLHDGAQQRLVHTVVTLKLVQRALEDKDARAESLLDDALAQAEQANAELRELAHGILPPVLTLGGLRAAVSSLVERLAVPVDVDVPGERFPAEIEASAYFILAEALTNVVKHSQATRAEVTATVEGGMLRLEARDDGVGGADAGGHGLVGIDDRVTALGGRLKIESPAGGGTRLTATLPLPARS